MTTIVTRAGKGSPLTNTEMDTNLTNLNSYKVEQDISGNATITGDVYLTGSGKRITGDFSNATIANRLMFQTSAVDGITNFGVIPNGTSPYSFVSAYNSSTPNNSAAIRVGIDGTFAYFDSTQYGTGNYLPMTFYTGGSERMRIDTAGNICIGGTPPETTSARSLDIEGNAVTPRILLKAIGATANTTTLAMDVTNTRVELNCGTWPLHLYASNILQRSTGGLGYGTGAGGTVTQATSKSTAVTLNKPTGQITMNNAALAAGATVQFNCNNTLVSTTDLVILNVPGGVNYSVWGHCAAGVIVIYVRNISGGSLADAVSINFAIIKGAAA